MDRNEDAGQAQNGLADTSERQSEPRIGSPQPPSLEGQTGRSASEHALYGRSYRLGGNLHNTLHERSLPSGSGGGIGHSRKEHLGETLAPGSSVRNRSAELGAVALEYPGSHRRGSTASHRRGSSDSAKSTSRAPLAQTQTGLNASKWRSLSGPVANYAYQTNSHDHEARQRPYGPGPSVVKDFEPPSSPPSAGSSIDNGSPSLPSPAPQTPLMTASQSERDLPSALSVMIQRHTPSGSRASSRSNSLTRATVETGTNAPQKNGRVDPSEQFLVQPKRALFPRTKSKETLHTRGQTDSSDSPDRPLLATPEDEASAMKELRRRDKTKYGKHGNVPERLPERAASQTSPAEQRTAQVTSLPVHPIERSDRFERFSGASGLEGIPEERNAHIGRTSIFERLYNYAARGTSTAKRLPLLSPSSRSTQSARGYKTFRPSTEVTSGSAPKCISPSSSPHFTNNKVFTKISAAPKSWVATHGVKTLLMAPLNCMPAVVLGTLLNILDGVSYGMITFPTNLAVFASFGGDGVSMYFISCIASQLVYTWGGSAFGGGNGTMMIEIVPFLHIIAQIIIDTIGDPKTNAHAIRATTMVAFALSSLLTGVAFMLLGALRLGALIGFFPRHILVGCIGGVGVFLFVTGIEVAARLEDNLTFDLDSARYLFLDAHNLALWTIPLGLAVLLRLITFKFDHSLLTPVYFISIPVIFYIIKAAAGWDLATLRQSGWLFDIQDDGTPWYHFYSYFDFGATNWSAIMATIPSQLALVFFGILHVPINVPALGVSLQKDDIKTDRELIAHGASNLLSGAVGSVPNYLCYVNSVLFYRVGGDSRLAGTMLALSTFIIMLLGPGVIGYIPVCVVGALIFLLGLDLIKEAVWDTWGKTDIMETLTIWAIMVSMTYWDFVIGIGVGIVLACFFFVVMTSRRQAIRVTYTGETAKSTVRRHVTQRNFLRAVGKQILVFKLQGFLFFGTISAVEDRISQILDLASWEHHPLRFLILDMSLVNGVDFSAAEAFLRIKRLLRSRNVIFVLTGSSDTSPGGRALQTAGIWEDVLDDESPLQAFDDMNEALEWCENMLLKQLYAVKSQNDSDFTVHSTLPVSLGGIHNESSEHLSPQKHPLLVDHISPSDASPRRSHLREAARQTFKHHNAYMERQQLENSQQPVPLLMQVFSAYSRDDQSFFDGIAMYFKKIMLEPGSTLFKEGENARAMYIIESGVLRATYCFAERTVVEAMLPGCVAGDMSFISGTPRNATVQAERQSVLWMLDEDGKMKIAEQGYGTYNKIISMILRCSADEQDVLLHYMVTAFS